MILVHELFYFYLSYKYYFLYINIEIVTAIN